jgi:hypothetical protein
MASFFIMQNNKVKRMFPLVLSMACLVTAILFKSRSFAIGYAFSLFFLLLIYTDFRLYRKIVYIPAVLLILFIIGTAVCFKTDSSLGRLFVYKISFRVLKDNFVTGVGWGHFSRVYNQYQAAYFKSGHYNEKELLLADNILYAYNDYLQLVIETGITGLAVLVAAVVGVVIIITKTLKRRPVSDTPAWVLIAVTQLIAMAVAALFRPVYYHPFFLSVFITALTVLCHYLLYGERLLVRGGLAALLLIVAIAWLHYGYYIRHYSSYVSYKAAKELAMTGYNLEAVQAYKPLYPILIDDNFFCSDYANALVNAGEYRQAMVVLERLVFETQSGVAYLQLANCYMAQGSRAQAEQAYWAAIYARPNRFLPRFCLFDFYCKTNQPGKAITVGKTIISLPVKIPSTQVSYIKQAVSRKLLYMHE